MKNAHLIVILYLSLLILSCSNGGDNADIIVDHNNTMNTTNSNNTNNSDNTGTLKGTFESGAHTTTGTVSVNKEKTVLTFNNFMTDNGPKLEVWLTTDKTPTGSSYISLGELKGISGDYNYNFPANVDFSTYNYVIIWCVEASVTFGYAKVQ